MTSSMVVRGGGDWDGKGSTFEGQRVGFMDAPHCYRDKRRRCAHGSMTGPSLNSVQVRSHNWSVSSEPQPKRASLQEAARDDCVQQVYKRIPPPPPQTERGIRRGDCSSVHDHRPESSDQVRKFLLCSRFESIVTWESPDSEVLAESTEEQFRVVFCEKTRA